MGVRMNKSNGTPASNRVPRVLYKRLQFALSPDTCRAIGCRVVMPPPPPPMPPAAEEEEAEGPVVPASGAGMVPMG